jgi:hypothetical protein
MRFRLAVIGLLACVPGSTPTSAQSPDPALFRVFLVDGRVLSAYGEWARLDERVVFSMPTRAAADVSDLHLVSIPSSQVDWLRTDRYASTVRAAAYAASRGEADFARLSDDVARALNQVALVTDPVERLKTAERARQALNDFPGRHFGYRAGEVREIVGLLDEVIAELRIQTGQRGFDLSLSAPIIDDVERPLPPPTHAEIVEQLLTASSLAETAAERTSLLHTVLGLLDRAAGLLPEAWADRVRRAVLGSLAEERRVETAYAELRSSTLASALKLADKADVRGLERLRATIAPADARLGGHRPGEVAALLATVDAELESARQLRLAKDQWELRWPRFRRYRQSIDGQLKTLTESAPNLEDVRAQAGPSPAALTRLLGTLGREARRLAAIIPPVELVAVHALLRSACEMAENAATLRLQAASDNDLDRAQQASSAAAGALMLLAKARADLDAALRPPVRQ